MNIKDFKQDYLKQKGQKAPISGGLGQSIDDPMIIEEKINYVSWEYSLINFFNEMSGTEYKIISQEVIEKDGQIIDCITCSLKDDEDSNFCFYFDITAGYHHKS